VSSQDGKILLFLSAKQAVNSGAHNATDSLHKMNWPSDWKMDKELHVTEVVCPSVYPDLFFTVVCSLFSF
jgi:acylaminoacyl-peptidase